MDIILETPRLILRELVASDAPGMFELDSNPEVHRYLGNKPISSIKESEDVIEFVRKQYLENGIGRWAMVLKSNNAFMGWAGLKLIKEETNGHLNYYDLGYRLIQKFWGQGFATEAAAASRDYCFSVLQSDVLYATTHIKNLASQNVLEKTGLKKLETFMLEDEELYWHRMYKTENTSQAE